MALMKCPECNKQISDKAKSCPECGYPINNINTALKKSAESVGNLGQAAKNIVSEVTTDDAKGCLSGIGCIIGGLVIIVLLIISVFGFPYIMIGGLPIAISAVCIGIYQLMKKVNPEI